MFKHVFENIIKNMNRKREDAKLYKIQKELERDAGIVFNEYAIKSFDQRDYYGFSKDYWVNFWTKESVLKDSIAVIGVFNVSVTIVGYGSNTDKCGVLTGLTLVSKKEVEKCQESLGKRGGFRYATRYISKIIYISEDFNNVRNIDKDRPLIVNI